jgi:hypothetical protein
MNLRVDSAKKKKEEMDAQEKEAFITSSVEKLSAAEERRAQMIEETVAKNSAEVAKVRCWCVSDLLLGGCTTVYFWIVLSTVQAKDLAVKKQQHLQELDEKLREKISAADERRNNLLTEQKERAAAAVEHARQVAVSHAEKEATAREELRAAIETKLEEAESRRLSSSPSKSAKSPSTPADGKPASEKFLSPGPSMPSLEAAAPPAETAPGASEGKPGWLNGYGVWAAAYAGASILLAAVFSAQY